MDACLFAVAFWLAFQLRTSAFVVEHLHLHPVEIAFERVVWLYVLLIPAGPFVLEMQGFYSRPWMCSRLTTAWQLLKGCVLVTAGLVVALFLNQMQIARIMLIWFGAISFVLIFIKEEIVRMVYRSMIAQAQYKRLFILVGTADETARMRDELNRQEDIAVLAELNLTETPLPKLIQMLHDYSVNGVILSAKHSHLEPIEGIIRACELEGVEVWLVADFFRTQISRPSLDDLFGWPVMVFRTTPEPSWQRLVKHVMDFFGALILLIFLAIPLMVVALLVKLTSPGPVFFRQQRSGLNGRPFVMNKFRTMVVDAESRKQELASRNEMSGPVFKVTNDPRVTGFGRFLRKYSVDELPQIVNVLRGEMSLVGPRPLPVDEVKRFDDFAHRRRLSVKPGLTCLWQISGRNNVSDFNDWVRLDLEYIDNWSLWLDLKILWWTVPAVLGGSGAK